METFSTFIEILMLGQKKRDKVDRRY